MEKKSNRVHMAKLLVKKSNINGYGIYANAPIKKNTTITIFRYHIYRRSPTRPLPNYRSENFWGRWLQVGKHTHMKPNGLLNFLNHSCNPNSGFKIVKGTAKLVSIRNIHKDEEITYDYATTITKDEFWRMKCNCASKNCRHVIGPFSYLPAKIRNRYIKLGIVPKYVQNEYKHNLHRALTIPKAEKLGA